MKPFLILILSLSFTFTAIGQTLPDTGFTNASGIKFYPLLRDTNDIYPKHIRVEGRIIKVCPMDVYCGVLCGSGTMKVWLEEPIKNYIGTYIFIALPCFCVNASDYLNKMINIKVGLLGKNDSDCYWTGPFNTIDSKGVPFYIPDSLDEDLHVQDNPYSGFTNKAEAKNLLVNGLKEGKWIGYKDSALNFTTDSNPPYFTLTIYKGGKPYGIIRDYFKSGKIKAETPTFGGLADGLGKVYNENGTLVSEIPCTNNMVNGMAKWYYEDGKLEEEAPISYEKKME